MRIILLSTPFTTTRMPPLALGLLSAVLKEKNHDVKSIDLNLKLFIDSDDKSIFKYGSGSLWKKKDSYKKIKTELIDKNIEKYLEEICSFNPELIGISSWHGEFTEYLSKKIKEKINIPIICGGPAASVLFDELQLKPSKNIDMVVSGEGEIILPQIVDFFHKNKKLPLLPSCKLYRNDEILICEDIPEIVVPDSLPYSDFSSFDLNKYTDGDFGGPAAIPLLFSRGCTSNCHFCMDRPMWGKNFRYKSPHLIRKEIEDNYRKYGKKNFIFLDLCLNNTSSSFKNLLNELNKLQIAVDFCGQAKFSRNIDEEIVKLMKSSNLIHLTIGLESASNSVLKKMNKGYTKEIVKENLLLLSKYGILVNTNLIAGFPGETLEDVYETIEFIKEFSHCIWSRPSVTTCSAPPASNLFLEKEKFDILFEENDREKHETWISKNGKLSLEERQKRVNIMNDSFKNMKFQIDRQK